MKSRTDRVLILHPLLFSLYPGIALLANNIEEIEITVALRALAVTTGCSLIFYFVLRFLFKDKLKAAITTSLFLIVFFSYGHIYNYLQGASPLGVALGRHRFLAPITISIAILVIGWVIRKGNKLLQFNNVLNWIAIIALIIPLFQIGSFEIRARNTYASSNHSTNNNSRLSLPDDQIPPDIYYIIVDAYARDDTLLEDHNLDNTPFLDQLSRRGFFVGKCSQSNYSQTQLSLASSLNIDYIQSLDDQYVAQNTSRVGIQDLIKHSQVRQSLEELGYTTIAFETGFKGTQWEDADVYLSPPKGLLERMQIAGGLNDFEAMLLKTSAGLLLSDASSILPDVIRTNLDNPRLIHRQRILFALDQLQTLASTPGPKFVFAHLVIPHPPYVFGPEGEFTDYDIDANIGYPDQIIYLNGRLVQLIDELISKSTTPPIIIIQADHGAIHSPPSKRLNILNTYYFPGEAGQGLYTGISPVNSFRVVFNNYFGSQYPILDDTGYYSIYQTPYDFSVIPETRPGCEK